MNKKQYQSPTMKVVEFEVEQHLLAASTEKLNEVTFTWDDEE